METSEQKQRKTAARCDAEAQAAWLVAFMQDHRKIPFRVLRRLLGFPHNSDGLHPSARKPLELLAKASFTLTLDDISLPNLMSTKGVGESTARHILEWAEWIDSVCEATKDLMIKEHYR